ncbi:hypothetical protein [Salinispora arenicola]|uniref:hypothetical protein n=1 Tax=Salinispora arenicola TaxID=168697 RepID=UPI003CC75287
MAVAVGGPPAGRCPPCCTPSTGWPGGSAPRSSAGVHGDRLVIVLGGVADPVAATGKLLDASAAGPVVVGPAVPSLDEATDSARAALAGFRAAPAWPPHRGRSPQPTCYRNGRSPGTPRRAAGCGTTCTPRWSAPAGNCWRPWTPSSPPAAPWRAPLGRCSYTPTPCGTGCDGWRR